ncbi:MAG: hypothetical protein U0414_41025 [Polyangiaceae bacterium]
MSTRFALISSGLVALLVGACCSETEETRCFPWPSEAECPTRAEAEADPLKDVDEVTSDATYWPAHAYDVDGTRVTVAAECCYEVIVTRCTL